MSTPDDRDDELSAEAFATLAFGAADAIARDFARHMTTIDWDDDTLNRLRETFREGMRGLINSVADAMTLGAYAGRAQAIKLIEQSAEEDDDE